MNNKNKSHQISQKPAQDQPQTSLPTEPRRLPPHDSSLLGHQSPQPLIYCNTTWVLEGLTQDSLARPISRCLAGFQTNFRNIRHHLRNIGKATKSNVKVRPPGGFCIRNPCGFQAHFQCVEFIYVPGELLGFKLGVPSRASFTSIFGVSTG